MEAAVCPARRRTLLARTKFGELRSARQTNQTRDRVRCSASREHRNPELLAVGGIEELQPVRSVAEASLNLARE